jgi:DNA polymerase I-like protein with 3'-5' exonuclease and polymerase domains
MRLASDIETDGLLDELTQIHCLVNIDIDTGERWRYGPHGVARTAGLPLDGVKQLLQADEVAFHNGIKFDVPAIKKVTGIDLGAALGFRLRDTLVETRLIYSNLKDLDAKHRVRWNLPGKLFGSYSLKAWGFRLGVYKDDFGESADWSVFTPAMLDYCEQDVVVTVELVKKLDARIATYSRDALILEHRVAWLMAQQERNGFNFDIKKAVELYAVLQAQRTKVEEEVLASFGGWFAPNLGAQAEILTLDIDGKPKRYRVKIPKRTVNAKPGSKTLSTIAGAPYTPVKWVDFNPTSRQHIARVLMARGWKPKEMTEKGDPKVDEAVLEKLPYPEAKLLARLFMIQKRIGQLAEGDQAWLKQARRGFIHGSVNPNGAVTGRATHSYPNVAQVPSCGVEFGKECRELFRVPDGWVLLGSDASGLELRCLGHFMARWDGGAYIKEILEGDIHTANQKAAGLEQRSQAKTFIYAFLYGAGDVKIGSIVNPKASAAIQGRLGKALKEKFLRNTPALLKLRQFVAEAAKKGYLIGLDGRKVYVRSAHAALNTLLQSAGGLICKLWICEVERLAIEAGLRHGWDGDFAFCAWVHDEIQVACRSREIAEKMGAICKAAMKEAEKIFKFRCPLDAEFAIGATWAETH